MHTLAYVAGGHVVLQTADGRLIWRAPADASPLGLAWSADGQDLAVVSRRRITVLGRDGRVQRTVSLLGGSLAQAAFRPASHELAVSLRAAGRSEVKLVDIDRPGTARLLFAGPGTFGDLAWSPDGAWLLVDWPTADQWLFLRGAHVRAVANIRRQFPRAAHPARPLELAGRWCCQ
jgi:hypothetical protein